MAEKQTRYNELLGVSNAIRDPDLYQLLGLDRARFDEAAVDTAYKEQMSKLQRIRSPKHKSFIEYLKGELRTARTTLTSAPKRAEYDEELLEERRGQLTMILEVVLSDGTLSEVEEERLRGIAADVGLFPEETDRVLDEELAARGACRERDRAPAPAPAPPPPAQSFAPPPQPTQQRPPSGRPPARSPNPAERRPSSGSWATPAPARPPARPTPAADTGTFGGGGGGFFPGGGGAGAGAGSGVGSDSGFFPTAAPDRPAASDSDIQRAIADRLKPTTRRRTTSRPPPSSEDEVVTAELVEEPPRPARPATQRPAAHRQPPPAPVTPQPPPQRQSVSDAANQRPGWGQQAAPARATGWGRSAQVRQVGVCTGCLAPVTDQDLQSGKGERFPDGRMHCPSCTNRLVAGLICSRCYNRITRADMKGRDLVIQGGRVVHARCPGT
ncbi:MAG: hypothetical protein AB7N76_04490 [Planctomycetota bacterium]